MSSSYTRSCPPDSRVSSVFPAGTVDDPSHPADGPDACAGAAVVVGAGTVVVSSADGDAASSSPEQAARRARVVTAAQATRIAAAGHRRRITSVPEGEAEHATSARTLEQDEAIRP